MPDVLRSAGFFELWHPEVWLGLLGIGLFYWFAVGPRRTEWFRQSQPVSPWQIASFLSGLTMIGLAEGTPIHLISDSYLFSMHMFQHMLLTLGLPPLLLLGLPDWLLRPVLGRPGVARVWRVLTSPLMGVLVFNFIFALYHFPWLYDGALEHHPLHMLEHALFTPTALFMWWPILSPMPEFPRPSIIMQIFYLFLVSLSQIAVYGILGFAEDVLYHTYAHAPRLWGITPLVDQQLAASVMELTAFVVLLTALGMIFARWSKQEHAREPYAMAPQDPISRS